MSNQRETGLKIFEEVYGPEAAARQKAFIESSTDFGAEYARWSNDFAFGTVWSREGLDRKLRSCAVLGMVIALRQSDEIRYHTKMGIANGLSRQELEEVLYTTVPYVGFPAANVAKRAMLAAFSELDEAAKK